MLMIVTLCAASKIRLDPPTIRSYVDTGAFLAARCAARSLCIRCSNVSPTWPGPPAPAAFVAEALDRGCGVVEVKRVASVALRGPTRVAILETLAKMPRIRGG